MIIKKQGEEKLVDISFHVKKFTTRSKQDVIIFPCFFEFGCEIMGSLYCIPYFRYLYPDKYFIAVGWYGREYLYKHLVDEFWECKEEYQWLRDYALAFHNNSRNIAKLLKSLIKEGKVIGAEEFGKLAVWNYCKECSHSWNYMQNSISCPSCKKDNVSLGLFSNIIGWRDSAIKIPVPCKEKLEKAKNMLGENPVAITARNRKTYNRNLPADFYKKLIFMIKDMGYSPIWVGEKQTTLPCPVPDIIDLTRKEEVRDLEFTLAIVKQCKFTIQYWTASTRLAGMMGIPYLLFESPDQIYGKGQEGYRLSLCTFGKKKLCLCNYVNLCKDYDTGIALTKRCIEEMQENKWGDVIGMIDEIEYVSQLRKNNLHKVC